MHVASLLIEPLYMLYEEVLLYTPFQACSMCSFLLPTSVSALQKLGTKLINRIKILLSVNNKLLQGILALFFLQHLPHLLFDIQIPKVFPLDLNHSNWIFPLRMSMCHHLCKQSRFLYPPSLLLFHT